MAHQPQSINIEALISQLRQVREDKGETAFQEAIQNVAEQIIHQPEGEAFLKAAIPGINVEELKARMTSKQSAGTGSSPDESMRKMLAMQVPNMKTQAQFNAFMVCFDALRATLNADFGGQTASAEMAREILGKALDMAKQVTEAVERLNEMPDEAKSEAAKEFTQPAKELHEYDTCKRLVGELEGLQSSADLKKWWADNRQTIDEVVSTEPRNELMDAVRARRNALADREAN